MSPNVTVKTLVSQRGLTPDMASRWTYSQRLNEKGYGFYQTCKKALVSERQNIANEICKKNEAFHAEK